MNRPKVCVLRTAGTNCDKETAFAFTKAGAEASLVHINEFISTRRSLDAFQVLALPGGFSYGDDIASGKIFANELKYKLREAVKAFVAAGKPVIGICNGFQILVKSGLLPGSRELQQDATLTLNDSGKFEARWTYLRVQKPPRLESKCIWTRNLPEIIYLPVAHGEGKFIARDKQTLARLQQNQQVVFLYCDAAGRCADYPADPNGSQEHIAGICDESGLIMGLMPHPERHVDSLQHPRRSGAGEGDGLPIFKNGVDYARTHL